MPKFIEHKGPLTLSVTGRLKNVEEVLQRVVPIDNWNVYAFVGEVRRHEVGQSSSATEVGGSIENLIGGRFAELLTKATFREAREPGGGRSKERVRRSMITSRLG
mgnify:CR=1 FL=1